MESVILTFNLLQLLFYFESKISEVQKSPKFKKKFLKLQVGAKWSRHSDKSISIFQELQVMMCVHRKLIRERMFTSQIS